jgi:hypothetical protein
MQIPFWKDQAAQHRARRAGIRVVADDAAVTARFEAIDRPFMHFVANCRFTEEHPPVRRDVEIVRQLQARIVDNGKGGSIRLVGELRDRSVQRNGVQTHALAKAIPRGRPPTWARISCFR